MPSRDFGASAVHRHRGESKIGDEAWPLAVDHDVAGLQVAMQHALSWAAARPAQMLAREIEGLVGGQPADAAQERAQVLAIDVLHRKVGLAVNFAEIVNAADVGVRDLARDAHFVVKARQHAAHLAPWLRAGT